MLLTIYVKSLERRWIYVPANNARTSPQGIDTIRHTFSTDTTSKGFGREELRMSARSEDERRFIETTKTSRIELFLCKKILFVIFNPTLRGKRFSPEWLTRKFNVRRKESRTQGERRTKNIGVGFMGFRRERPTTWSKTTGNRCSEKGRCGIEGH